MFKDETAATCSDREISNRERFRAELASMVRIAKPGAGKYLMDFKLQPGGGQPVLLIPGFGESDRELRWFKRWLEINGYVVGQPDLGRNTRCFTKSERMAQPLLEKLVADNGGRKAICIGHSLGGLHSRVLAAKNPDLVKAVITLGSPFVKEIKRLPTLNELTLPMYAAVTPLMLAGTLSGRRLPLPSISCVSGKCCAEYRAAWRQPLHEQISFLQVQSPLDGIVNWQNCVIQGERLELIHATHMDMVLSRGAFEAIGHELDRLLTV